MNRAIALLIVLAAALSPACAQTPAAPFQPEQLRGFERDTLVIQRSNGRDQFRIWLAETPAQHQQGLMWIQRLPPDYGMLFLQPEVSPMTMWMKNTFVPLDMVFFDERGRILRIHERAVPQSEAFINSEVEVAGVLEILGGEARRRGLRIGDRLLHPRLDR
jgi:uncharacterized membrane protein (UPF0127 family)